MIICAPEYLRVLSSLPIKFGPDSGLESVSDTWNHEDPRRHPLQQQQDVEFNENKLELCVCVHGNKGVKIDVS